MSRPFVRAALSLATALACLPPSLPAWAQAASTLPVVPATLVGHALLPADTTVAPPADAGPLFASVGKFAAPNRQRSEALQSIVATSFVGDPKLPRASGGKLPMAGQLVQGFSALSTVSRDEFLVLTDNGLGNKLNSVDALLMVHRMKIDWNSGKVERQATTFLRDPDRKVPFFIVNENSPARYLTGADFDPESIQVIGDSWYIGDEFGPYVLRVDANGVVRDVIETEVAGRPLRSPDHYLNGRLPNLPGDAPFEVRRSNGFEPMAKSVDGRTLYPMFEGPLWDAQTKAVEQVDGVPYVRILELDVATKRYTNRQWKYKLEATGYVVSDFLLLDERIGLVIERDDATEGVSPACPNEARTDCFTRPAAFKRIVKFDLGAADADGFVRKVASIDLTNLDNPGRLAKIGPNEDRFVLPQLGPEGIALVGGRTLLVVNDNNFPYSSGRTIGQPDPDEFTLMDIGALLDAR